MIHQTWLFRVASRPEFGGGHIKRCLALARSLARAHVTVQFVLDCGGNKWISAIERAGFHASIVDPEETAPVAGVVLDHLDAALAEPSHWRKRANTLVTFRDGREAIARSDIEIRQWEKSADAATSILAGLHYAVIEPAFAGIAPAPMLPWPEHVLIAFGYRDSPNATGSVLAMLQCLASWRPRVTVALGGDAPHLRSVRDQLAAFGERGRLLTDSPDLVTAVAEADLVVGGGGVSAAERAAAGRPSLTWSRNEGQAVVGSMLEAAGATWHLTGNVSAERLFEALRNLASNVGTRRAMACAGRKAIDGRGSDRIVERILQLAPVRC